VDPEERGREDPGAPVEEPRADGPQEQCGTDRSQPRDDAAGLRDAGGQQRDAQPGVEVQARTALQRREVGVGAESVPDERERLEVARDLDPPGGSTTGSG
jgi:hypothetical protein